MSHCGGCSLVYYLGMTRRREEKSSCREERKERTRQRLLDAAMELMGDEGSFTGLSLRRVARHARITPNAFYRHFGDMAELGLALLDGIGPTLRRLLREVRKVEGMPGPEVVRLSVDAYMDFVRSNQRIFALIVRERAGGSARIRAAIRRDMGYFASELASDVGDLLPQGLRLSARTTQQAAELIVELMLGVATEILDLPEGEGPDAVAAEDALRDRFVQQLLMILAGALTLDGQRVTAKASEPKPRPTRAERRVD